MTLLRLAAPLAFAVAYASRVKLVQLGQETSDTIPMRLYRQDCGKRAHFRTTRNSKKLGLVEHVEQDPGAGMDPDNIEPFTEVLKDGFYQVDCVKDYMFVHGDAHGDGKFSYKLGKVANVSIIHYNDIVAKEDREAMSHATCFAFCRTVPDMMFFGIHNGRDCYCAPYYQAMAGDSSDCDASCPGEKTLMCGGKSKSSIFAMHLCEDSEKELQDALEKLEDVEETVTALHDNITAQIGFLKHALRQKIIYYGQRGDVGTTANLQAANVFKGELEESADGADALLATIETLKSEADGFSGQDMKSFDVVTDLEKLIKQMEKATAVAEVKIKELELLQDKVMILDDPTGASEQYYKAMYFVDKEQMDYPSTCGGDLAGPPFAFENHKNSFDEDYDVGRDVCAAMCDKNVGNCVGFQLLFNARASMCVTFSKFKTAFYYTGCTEERVQLAAGKANLTQCYAKFTYYEGTSLAPNPKGTCKQCFKKLTHADRCYTGGLNEF